MYFLKIFKVFLKIFSMMFGTYIFTNIQTESRKNTDYRNSKNMEKKLKSKYLYLIMEKKVRCISALIVGSLLHL